MIALTSSMERAPWGWVLVVIVAGALIKVWPIINAQLLEAKAKLRGEERADLHDCNEKLNDLRIDFDAFKDNMANFKVKMNGVLNAYRILEADVETYRPDAPALRQARRILRDVFEITEPMPGDMTTTISQVQ